MIQSESCQRRFPLELDFELLLELPDEERFEDPELVEEDDLAGGDFRDVFSDLVELDFVPLLDLRMVLLDFSRLLPDFLVELFEELLLLDPVSDFLERIGSLLLVEVPLSAELSLSVDFVRLVLSVFLLVLSPLSDLASSDLFLPHVRLRVVVEVLLPSSPTSLRLLPEVVGSTVRESPVLRSDPVLDPAPP